MIGIAQSCRKCITGRMVPTRDDPLELACVGCGNRVYIKPTGELHHPITTEDEGEHIEYRDSMKRRDQRMRQLYRNGEPIRAIADRYKVPFVTAFYIVTKGASGGE